MRTSVMIGVGIAVVIGVPGMAGLAAGAGRQPDQAAGATARTTRPALLAGVKRGFQRVGTRWRLHRQYAKVFRISKELVVSHDADLLPLPATGDGDEVGGAAFVVDKVTGQHLRPMRLLRRSYVERQGPTRAQAESALEDFMFDAFEYLDYRPAKLSLRPDDEAGTTWTARFKGAGTRGKAVLFLTRQGRWVVDQDSESGTYAEDLAGDASFPSGSFFGFGLPAP